MNHDEGQVATSSRAALARMLRDKAQQQAASAAKRRKLNEEADHQKMQQLEIPKASNSSTVSSSAARWGKFECRGLQRHGIHQGELHAITNILNLGRKHIVPPSCDKAVPKENDKVAQVYGVNA